MGAASRWSRQAFGSKGLHAPAWGAWSLFALTLALIAGAFLLFTVNRHTVPQQFPSVLFTEVFAALVGALIVSHKPRNPIGWFIVAHALCFSLAEFTRQYAIYGVLTEPGSLPLARAMASPPYWLWFPGLVLMLAFLPLYFPNGRLLSPRWRPVVWVAGCVAAITTATAAVLPDEVETPGIPNPLGIEALRPYVDALESVLLLWLGVVIASAASLVVRFGRSRGEERQQLKWFVYAVVFVILYIVATTLFRGLLPGFLPEVLDFVALSGLWVAILVAIFRYRLYDVDLLINRTLVYGSLTVTLLSAYFGGIVVLQRIFVVLTGQESTLAIVASTLLIAALFSPLRGRIQSFIDRRFYRSRYDMGKTLEAFSAKLRDETDLEALGDELLGVVGETMQPAHVSVWLRPDPASEPAAE